MPDDDRGDRELYERVGDRLTFGLVRQPTDPEALPERVSGDRSLKGDLRVAVEEALLSLGIYMETTEISNELGDPVVFDCVPARIGLIALLELRKEHFSQDPWEKIALLGTTLSDFVKAIYIFCRAEEVDKTRTRRLSRAWRKKYFDQAEFFEIDEIKAIIGQNAQARMKRLMFDLGLEERPTGFSLSDVEETLVVNLLADVAMGSGEEKKIF